MRDLVFGKRFGISQVALASLPPPVTTAPRSSHNPDLLKLVRERVSPSMISYIAKKAASIISVDGDSSNADAGGNESLAVKGVKCVENPLPTPPHTPDKTTFGEGKKDASSGANDNSSGDGVNCEM